MIGVYVRVSTEEQKKGYSIEGQMNDCIQMAKTDDVIKYVDDGYTGEILNRPALSKMLEDAENEMLSTIICYDPDRLSRKLLNQLIITEKLEKANIELKFVRSDYKSDPEGQLYFQIRGAFSEFDKAKIKHNTMTGRYRKAKMGFVVKNNYLFGYDYDRDKKTYIINEDEAKVIQVIFNYFTDPHTKFKGINGIAKHLTELGIPTARGKKVWHRQVVRQILMNESYTGRYYQNKYDTEGDYVRMQAGEHVEHGRLRPKEEWLETSIPAIITDEQFNFAQRKISRVRRRYTNYGQHNYLLSGIVRCGRCGGTMTGRNSFNRGKDYFTYECRKNYAGAKNSGCGRMMSENKLNNIVWSNILDLLNNPDKVNDYRHDKIEEQYVLDEMSHLEQQIKRVQNGRKRLISLITISDDDIDLEEIKDKMKELQENEKQYKDKLQKLKKENKQQDHKLREVILKDALNYFLSIEQEKLTKNQMKKVIRMIVEEVIVVDSKTVYIHTF